MGRRWTAMIAVTAGAAWSACAPPASRGGFDAPDPASKLYAIEHAMRAHDRSAVPRIVEELDSDDPAVRMLAAAALEHLTGQTLGYDHTDPPAQRQEAIRRWQQYVAEHADEFGSGVESADPSMTDRDASLLEMASP